MTYTLRIYSRDNEGISSAIITFMTSTGERGPGPAIPYKHGHFILILSFLLEFAPRKEDPSPPIPHLAWRVSALILCSSRQEKPKMHARWRGNRTSNPVETSGAPRKHCRIRTRGPPAFPAVLKTKGLGGCGAAGVPHSCARDTGWLPAHGTRGQGHRRAFPQEPSERSARMSLPCHRHLSLKYSKVCYTSCLGFVLISLLS